MAFRLTNTQTRQDIDIKWYHLQFPEKKEELNEFRRTNFPGMTYRDWFDTIPLPVANPHYKVLQYVSESREELERYVASWSDPTSPMYAKAQYDAEVGIETEHLIEEE